MSRSLRSAVLFALGWALSASAAHPLQPQAAREVRLGFEGKGRRAPKPDAILDLAAGRIAAFALERGTAASREVGLMSSFISAAGGHDANPRAVIAIASPPSALFDALGKGFAEEPATHHGVGVAELDGRAAVVLLLTDRKSELDPFPRQFAKAGEVRPLCGRLLGDLGKPELFVTRPSGAVEKLPLTLQRGSQGFCATVPFPAVGRHAVELIGHGPRGPEVSALFSVQTGAATARAEARIEEPATDGEARAAVLSRVNSVRASRGVGPVSADEALDRIADAYAARMAKENFFGHVSPDGRDLKRRLTEARYLYEQAGENLGLASGALAAQAGIEQSPGHLRNLIEPRFSRMGVGLHRGKGRGGGTEVHLVQVFAAPLEAVKDPLAEVFRALDTKRASANLPKLRRNEALDRLAGEHARLALSLDKPQVELPNSSVHDRVFAAVSGVRSAAVDIFISDSPGVLGESASLRDKSNDLVGAAAVRADSPTYGRGKYWVVVIYADAR